MVKRLIALLLIMAVFFSILFSVTVTAKNNSQNEAQSVVSKESSIVTNNLSVSGTNSFGTMLSKVIDKEHEEQEDNQGNNIFSVVMENLGATVEFETTQNATLLVAIYSEDQTEMITTGSCDVTPDDNTANVMVASYALPEYFYVKAYLIDSRCYRPLCPVFESPNYTREMQEFFTKTVEDFDEDLVLNLDEDSTNNFAVYNNGVVFINNEDECKNIVSSANHENNVYVIDNADDNIVNLCIGDIFSYAYEEDELLIVKVKNISFDGTTATIIGDDIELEDAFDFVKIDESSNTSAATIDDSICDGAVEYNGIIDNSSGNSIVSTGKNKVELVPTGVDISGGFDQTLSFNVNSEKDETTSQDSSLKFFGGIELGIKANIKVYITWTKQYFELKLDYKGKIKISFTKSSSDENTDEHALALCHLYLTPIAGITIGLVPSFVFSISGSIEVSATYSGTIGVRGSMQEGIKNLTTTPDWEFEVKVEGKVFLGFKIEPEVSVLAGVVKAKITGKVGVEAKGELSYDFNTPESVYHECKSCIKGTISAVLSLETEIKFLNMNRLKLKGTLFDGSIKLCDFYWSLDFNDHGWTICPHKQYRLYVNVLNENHRPIENALVSVNNKELKTNKNGTASILLKPGNYDILVYKSSFGSTYKTVKITDESESRTYYLKSSANTITNDDLNNLSIKSISVSSHHTAIVNQKGELYTCGANGNGQLGDGTTTSKNNLTHIMDNVKYVYASEGENTAAITNDNKLYMWGMNWGMNDKIRDNGSYKSPQKVMDNVASVCEDNGAVAVITTNGDLYVWGDNSYGRLGIGSTNSIDSPVKVLSNVSTVCLKQYNCAALTKDGDVYTWGYNWYGQLGDGTRGNSYSCSPKYIMSNVKSIDIGFCFMSAIKNNGDLYLWGDNEYGQIGTGASEYVTTPQKVLSAVSSFTCSDYNSAAIDNNGNLYLWGWNSDGQIGDGTKTNKNTPTLVMRNIKSVQLGHCHCAAIAKNGDLFTWGRNEYLELGNGTTRSSVSPQKILENVAIVRLAGYQSKAVTNNNNIYAWGYNNSGQIGDGTKKNRLFPVKITLPSKKSDLASTGAVENNTIFFNGLNANSIYNVYSMMTPESDYPFSNNNLYYINQSVSNENGEIRLEYQNADNDDGSVWFAVPYEQTDITLSEIIIPSITYYGEEQSVLPIVKYEGNLLINGEDYYLASDYSINQSGEYTLTVVGNGLYKGRVTVSYNVLNAVIGDTNGNGVVDIMDATVIQRYLAHYSVDNESVVVKCGDVNSDGLDIMDATAIQRFLAQYFDPYHIGEPIT